ncbi:MAG TPA: acyl-CoA dehydrogenase family protein [Acidimicrobiales bacterium]|nr:acyl-CoA dehydrogenase family protein [Acidimicrobiales bacterium]
MYIGYTEEQESLRKELRDYYAQLITPEMAGQLGQGRAVGPLVRKLVRQMGADGWLGIGWPTEYGGQGRTPMEQFIFFDESMRAGAPVPMLTINTVGPTIMRFGTDEQKERFLPPILRGEIHFCIGYTESGSGTDLASLKTRAVKDGDEYVINGAKVFTSLASDADYVWLAARTDPEAKKHAGISIFIVPTSTPGFRYVPMRLIGEHDTNQTFYEDVRVPAANLVGGENQGWTLITNQLNHERVTLCSPGVIEESYDQVRRYAAGENGPSGGRLIDEPWVQLDLARVKAKLEFLKLANWKVASSPKLDVPDASTVKVFGTEFYLEALRLLLGIIGEEGFVVEGSPGAVLRGRLEKLYRSLVILTFGGGANEIQRELIAMFGLGMPHSGR